jgi:maleate isomerase
MSMGKGYHCQSERRLHEVTVREGAPAPVVTSAGALVHGLKTVGARKIAMIAPYMKPLTQMVAEYIEAEGIEVLDRIALEIPDNVEVGRRDPLALLEIYKDLKLDGVDALVLSSCVQMPSLAAIPIVE